jgi:response regulator of citrate/malate metabolism
MTDLTTRRLDPDWPSTAKLVYRELQAAVEPLAATEVADRVGLAPSTARRWCRELWRADEVEVVLDVEDIRRRPYRPANCHE